MFEMFLSTLEQMVRLFLVIFFGYVLNKSKAISKSAENALSRLVTLLFAPALSFYSFIVECQISSLISFGHLIIIGIAFRIASIFLSYPLGKWFSPKDTYKQGVYRYAFSFPNAGAFGTPLMLAMFGTAGLYQFSLFQMCGTFLTYTWGQSQMQPAHKRGSFWMKLFKCINPNTVAMLLGMILGILGGKNWMPSIVITTFKDLGTCYVICGLLVIGFTIADYPFKKIFSNIKVYIYSFLRLFAIPCFFLAVLLICSADELLCVMTILAYAAPCGMGAVIFPAYYNMECEDGAQMVLITSIASLFTIPLLCGLVKLFF